MHSAEIRRILSRIGWPTEIPEFDPSYDLADWDLCQLIPGTEDGFAPDETQFQGEGGPDPPFLENHTDPPHWEDDSDPPHWENDTDPPHWEDDSDPPHWEDDTDPPHWED